MSKKLTDDVLEVEIFYLKIAFPSRHHLYCGVLLLSF